MALLLISGSPVFAGTAHATPKPGNISFGNVALGSTSTRSVTIANDGTADYVITKLTASGAGYHFSGITAPHTVHAGNATTFSVEFTPPSDGEKGGTLSVATTASNGTIHVLLTGNGTGTAPSSVPAKTYTLSMSPTTLAFTREGIGSSESLAVTIKNTGNSSVKITGISTSSSQLGTSGSINGATLTAGQSATLNVIYSPTAAGSFSGSVKVTSTATNSPGTVTATGTAFTPTTAPEVSLDWDPSTSSGVAGYFLYRSTNSTSGFAKLNSAYVSGLKYTDDGVAHGGTYYYSVSAVSTAGIESAKCAPVKVSVP